MRETLPRPTDLPHAQRQLPQAIATLTTIEESITDIRSSGQGPCPREQAPYGVRYVVRLNVGVRVGRDSVSLTVTPRCSQVPP